MKKVVWKRKKKKLKKGVIVGKIELKVCFCKEDFKFCLSGLCLLLFFNNCYVDVMLVFCSWIYLVIVMGFDLRLSLFLNKCGLLSIKWDILVVYCLILSLCDN